MHDNNNSPVGMACSPTALPPDCQVTNLRDEVTRVRQVLTNKDQESAESIQKAGADLQKASLKLFEIAYKKVH